MTTIGFPNSISYLVISFISTLIYVKKQIQSLKNLTNEIKKRCKGLIIMLKILALISIIAF